MKNLYLLLIVFFFIGCKKNKSEAVMVDTSVRFSYRNAANENLLDPTLVNGIKDADIDTYVLVNGTKVKISNALMAAPENFRIINDASVGHILLFYFPEEPIVDNKVTCYLKLKSGREDEIAMELVRRGSSLSYDKVWVNGQLACSGNDCFNRTGPIIITIP